MTLRLVELDEPIANEIGKRIAPGVRSSTKVVAAVGSHGRAEELIALQCLEWDTRILGLRTGRLTEFAGEAARPSYPGLDDLLRSSGFEYVTVRRPVGEWARLRALEEAGFRLVDGILSFTKSISSTPIASGGANAVRAHLGGDTEAVVSLAIATFKRSRFHNDSAISNEAADRLHGEWARNSCTGQAAKAVLVVEDGSHLGGFITCKFGADPSIGVIDLVGVDPRSAGKGFGRALVEASEAWFAQNGCKSIQVQTQIDNFAAIRLYFGTGFVPTETFATLRWSAK